MINQLRDILQSGPMSVKDVQGIMGVKSGHILASIAKHHEFSTDRTQKPIMISLVAVPEAPELPELPELPETFTRDFLLEEEEEEEETVWEEEEEEEVTDGDQY